MHAVYMLLYRYACIPVHQYGRDWSQSKPRVRMARLCRTKETELSSCKWSCLVVFIVGLVRDDVMFGCMHASKFWVSDTWAPAPCVNQAVLEREVKIEKTKACGWRRADERKDAGERCEQGNQTRPQCTE